MNVREIVRKLDLNMCVRFLPPVILSLALFAVLAFAAPVMAGESPDRPVLPAVAAQEHEDEEGAGGEASGRAVAPTVLWSVAGILGGAVVFTALYMLKRRVGGFPESPDWVAPITIMYSKDSPAEGAFGDAGAHADAHGAHH